MTNHPSKYENHLKDRLIQEKDISNASDLGDNYIVFENFTASIGDLIVAN